MSKLGIYQKYLKGKLSNDRRWAIRALFTIRKMQTSDEILTYSTKHTNRRGFNRPDSRILSIIASQYEKTGYIRDEDLIQLHKRIPKYWKQLYRVSDRDKLSRQVFKDQEYFNF